MIFRVEWIDQENKKHIEDLPKSMQRQRREKYLLDNKLAKNGDCYIDKEDGNGFIYQYSFFSIEETERIHGKNNEKKLIWKTDPLW